MLDHNYWHTEFRFFVPAEAAATRTFHCKAVTSLLCFPEVYDGSSMDGTNCESNTSTKHTHTHTHAPSPACTPSTLVLSQICLVLSVESGIQHQAVHQRVRVVVTNGGPSLSGDRG